VGGEVVVRRKCSRKQLLHCRADESLQTEGLWGDASTTAASLVSSRNVNVSWR
jgi:hypothetical protein